MEHDIIEEAPQERPVNRRIAKPVAVVLDFGQIKVFPSIRKAAEYIDVSPMSLHQALNERRACYGMEVFYVAAEQR